MDKEKEKKKTLTISSNFKKKIDPSSLSKKENRKSFAISNDKKNLFKASKGPRKIISPDQNFKNQPEHSGFFGGGREGGDFFPAFFHNFLFFHPKIRGK